jgi:hypothetical protein
MRPLNVWYSFVLKPILCAGLFLALVIPAQAGAKHEEWQLGAYIGKYYDSEPAGFTQGRANFLAQNLFALTAKKAVWRSSSLPLALEIDAMAGIQNGIASLGEVAVAPALRFSGFPWNNIVHSSISIAPLGLSYTTSISPLERGTDGNGSQWLNWLFIEAAFANPKKKSHEFFFRLHHRCTIYDLINNYGANGEDFFAMGLRKRF